MNPKVIKGKSLLNDSSKLEEANEFFYEAIKENSNDIDACFGLLLVAIKQKKYERFNLLCERLLYMVDGKYQSEYNYYKFLLTYIVDGFNFAEVNFRDVALGNGQYLDERNKTRKDVLNGKLESACETLEKLAQKQPDLDILLEDAIVKRASNIDKLRKKKYTELINTKRHGDILNYLNITDKRRKLSSNERIVHQLIKAYFSIKKIQEKPELNNPDCNYNNAFEALDNNDFEVALEMFTALDNEEGKDINKDIIILLLKDIIDLAKKMKHTKVVEDKLKEKGLYKGWFATYHTKLITHKGITLIIDMGDIDKIEDIVSIYGDMDITPLIIDDTNKILLRYVDSNASYTQGDYHAFSYLFNRHKYEEAIKLGLDLLSQKDADVASLCEKLGSCYKAISQRENAAGNEKEAEKAFNEYNKYNKVVEGLRKRQVKSK